MFIYKRRDKWRLTERPFDRIPTRWKIVIAGLIGSGTGLFGLTMWCPQLSQTNESSYNETSELTPEIELLEYNSGIRISEKGRASIYCKNSGCTKVTCSSIPESQDPGQVASDFIMKILKIECPSTNSVEQLIFDTCIFPENKLNLDWLKSDLPIVWLTFRNCALMELPKGSFISDIFANTKILEIRTAKIRILRRWIFEELKNLNSLQIDDNIIHEADYDLLHSVADSLEVLMLDSCLKDVQVLVNITSGSSLTKVQIISIQRNSLSMITSEIFQATPNVLSLYLANSEITHFEANALTVTRSLLLLDLKNNLLTNLPKQLFASALKNPGFKVWMTENPWSCTCDFEWIQEMITDYPGALKEMPKCESPARNALKYFINAEFCDSSATAIMTTTTMRVTKTTALSTIETTFPVTNPTTDKITTQKITMTTDADNEIPVMKFTCKNSEISIMNQISRRKLFSVEEWEFPSRFHDFYAKPLTDGNVWINLKPSQFGVSLIWFLNEAQENSSTSVSCVSDVKGPLILTNLQRGRSYTICLLDKLGKAPSPFNCLATITDTELRTDTWLTNSDKGIVLSISISLLIIICIMSIIMSFMVIRRNPSLLRGSKRVVMVRKRSVEALVLPQGIRLNQHETKISTNTRKKGEPDYLTPLEMPKWSSRCGDPRRKDSKASKVSSQYGSGASYVELSPDELANWRSNGRIRSYSTCLEAEECEKCEEPPPLPPHRPTREQVIPSLSLAVQLNRDNATYHTFCVDTNELDPGRT